MEAAERRARIAGIREHVGRNDIASWIALQLGDLDRVAARAPV
jgi:trehalose-6-phosphate synthase